MPLSLKLIYADIGPALVADGANKPQLLKPLPDNRIEYAQLQHQSQPPIHSSDVTISICDAGKCNTALFFSMLAYSHQA